MGNTEASLGCLDKWWTAPALKPIDLVEGIQYSERGRLEEDGAASTLRSRIAMSPQSFLANGHRTIPCTLEIW